MGKLNMAAEGKPDLSGKYTLTKNEKFEEFLGANGAPWIARKMAGKASPTVTVEQNGDEIKMITNTMGKTSEMSVVVGQDFEEKMGDGSIMNVKPRWEDNKLAFHYEPKEGAAKAQTQYREVAGDEFIVTLKLGDITAKRYFKRES